MAKIYELRTRQTLPISLDEAWNFFSDPRNLQEITPKELNLVITNELYGDKMYPGQMITYRVKPLLGIPMNWATEITHVVEKKMFVDEQRTGPYSIWHHQHHFEQVPEGTLMTDIVHYQIPLGILGRMMHPILVRKKLKEIFDYRFQKVEQLFGKPNGPLQTAPKEMRAV